MGRQTDRQTERERERERQKERKREREREKAAPDTLTHENREDIMSCYYSHLQQTETTLRNEMK